MLQTHQGVLLYIELDSLNKKVTKLLSVGLFLFVSIIYKKEPFSTFNLLTLL